MTNKTRSKRIIELNNLLLLKIKLLKNSYFMLIQFKQKKFKCKMRCYFDVYEYIGELLVSDARHCCDVTAQNPTHKTKVL